jgi:hypothetical protein
VVTDNLETALDKKIFRLIEQFDEWKILLEMSPNSDYIEGCIEDGERFIVGAESADLLDTCTIVTPAGVYEIEGDGPDLAEAFSLAVEYDRGWADVERQIFAILREFEFVLGALRNEVEDSVIHQSACFANMVYDCCLRRADVDGQETDEAEDSG